MSEKEVVLKDEVKEMNTYEAGFRNGALTTFAIALVMLVFSYFLL